jgi:hypothetical protein
VQVRAFVDKSGNEVAVSESGTVVTWRRNPASQPAPRDLRPGSSTT